jgi:putative transposase
VLTVVTEDGARREDVSLLDDVVREGARRMLAAALEAEVDVYLAELADSRDERGRRLVVRNGYAQPREVMTAAGAVEVRRRGSTTSASTRRPVSASGSGQ